MDKKDNHEHEAWLPLIRTGEEIAREMRLSRRWANWRMAAFLAFPLIILAFSAVNSTGLMSAASIQIPRGEPYVSLVRIRGNIEPGGGAAAEFLKPALTRAFADKNSRGVVLLINSPGGTPVQANQLYEYIQFCKEHFDRKVIAVGEDMMTSGAYMVAVAADKIYVNRSTMTGSIGVVQHAFGYQGLAERIGIESRTISAGKNKNRLDPFKDLDPDDVEKMELALNKIHSHFIDVIQEGRGERLASDLAVFTGDFWTGEEAVELGLVDDVATLQSVLHREFDVRYTLDYSQRKGLLQGLNDILTASIESAIQSALASNRRGPPMATN